MAEGLRNRKCAHDPAEPREPIARVDASSASLGTFS
jgi:hypothetical protein